MIDEKLLIEYERIANISGVELFIADGLGNTHEIAAIDIAMMALTISRADLSIEERAAMLYGWLHSPAINEASFTNQEA